MLRPATKEPSLCGWYNYFKGISVGFIPMSNTVLRCDVEKVFLGLVLQVLRDSFNSLSDKHFRSPSYWQAVNQALCTAAPRALVVHGGNCFTPGPTTALTALLHSRKQTGVWREKRTACPLVGISWAWLRVLLNKFHHHPHSLNQNGPNKQKGFPLPSLSFWWVDISHAAD